MNPRLSVATAPRTTVYRKQNQALDSARGKTGAACLFECSGGTETNGSLQGTNPSLYPVLLQIAKAYETPGAGHQTSVNENSWEFAAETPASLLTRVKPSEPRTATSSCAGGLPAARPCSLKAAYVAMRCSFFWSFICLMPCLVATSFCRNLT